MCLEDGYEWNATVTDFVMNNSNCSRCSNKEVWSNRISEIDEKVKMNNYKLLKIKTGTNNIRSNSILILECAKKHTWNVTVSGFMNNDNKCPICTSYKINSFVHNLIESLLINSEIHYQREMKLEEVRSEKGRYLPYDIFIPSENLIIEIHGQQHYELSSWMTKESLHERKKVDKYKKQKAIELGYDFLEVDIREWEETVFSLDVFKKYKNNYKDFYRDINYEIKLNSINKKANSKGYSLLEVDKSLINSKTIITLMCKEHGAFNIDYNNFVNGDRGCYKCGTKRSAVSKYKKVLKITLEGDVLDEYISVKEAAEKNSISNKGISLCCNNKLKTYKGYVWKFK